MPTNISELTVETLAATIDHAILHPTLTDAQMLAEMQSIAIYPLATVCVKPHAVALAVNALAITPINIGTVVGFPQGLALPEVKALETEMALDEGAVEIDMVVNIGKVLSEDWDYIRKDIGEVISLTKERNALLKVIFETDYISNPDLKIRLCHICSELDVDYIKTSTGFGFVKGNDGKFTYTGATLDDIRLMRQHSNERVGIKASGGIRSLEEALDCLDAGATRIGTSSTSVILEGMKARLQNVEATTSARQNDY